MPKRLITLLICLLIAYSMLMGAQFRQFSGRSMSPTLESGDILWVEKEKTYQTGDIIIYNHPRMGRICHRIVWTDGEVFRSKGDYNRRFDDGVFPMGMLEGKVIGVWKGGEWDLTERERKSQ